MSPRYHCSQMVAQASTTTNTTVATNIETPPNPPLTQHLDSLTGETAGRHLSFQQISRRLLLALRNPLRHLHLQRRRCKPTIPTCRLSHPHLNIARHPACKAHRIPLLSFRRISHLWSPAPAKRASSREASQVTAWSSPQILAPIVVPTLAPITG